MDPLLGVVNLRRAAQPLVVLQVGWNRLARVIGPGGIDRQADLDPADLADAAGADQLTREAELRGRALLAADLHDATGFGNEVAQQDSLCHGHGEGLLDVHILSGEDGGGHELRMPVIGCADDHRIQVRMHQQLAVVGIQADVGRRAAGLPVIRRHLLLAVGHAPRIQIAHRDIIGGA